MAKRCECSNNSGSDEKILSESGLKHIVEKLTGKLLLAVGTIEAKGDGSLHLWRKYTDHGIVVHGRLDEATQEGSGAMSAEDKQRLDELWEKYENGDLGSTPDHYTDSYEWTELSLSYPQVAVAGGTYSPTLTYRLRLVRTYESGETEITGEWTSGAAVTWEIARGAGQRTLDSFDTDTGELTCSANEEDEESFIGKVTATLTLEGQTATVSCQVLQAARTYTDTYSTPTASISYSTALATDTQLSPAYSYSQTRTRTYSDGTVATSTLTSGATLNFQVQQAITDVSINASTGVLTFPVNPTTSGRRICYVLMDVTMNGETTQVSCEVRQEAASVEPLSVPTVTINTSSLYRESSSAATTRIYFNIDVTTDTRGAWIITPEYFLGDDGNQYEVTKESVRHEDGTSSGYYTEYWADLPYLGFASTTINSATLYTHYYGEYTDATTRVELVAEGDVASTNKLLNRAGIWGF